MIERMEGAGRQLNARDLEALEKAVGAQLPKEYRSFLLKYNGGIPTPNAFPVIGWRGNPTGEIQRFFGIGTEAKHNDIAWNLTTFADRLPDAVLPVGNSPSGDLVCISLRGSHSGRVLYWDSYGDSEPQAWGTNGASNLYPIAETFDELLRILGDYPVGG